MINNYKQMLFITIITTITIINIIIIIDYAYVIT